MVHVRQYAVKLVSVCVPPREHRHLPDNAQEHCQAAGDKPVDAPKQSHDDERLHTPEDHFAGMKEVGIAEYQHHCRGKEISQNNPFECHQAFDGLFLLCQQRTEKFFHRVLFGYRFLGLGLGETLVSIVNNDNNVNNVRLTYNQKPITSNPQPWV